LIGSFKISLPWTHRTISVVHQERDYSLMCPMPELVYSVRRCFFDFQILNRRHSDGKR